MNTEQRLPFWEWIESDFANLSVVGLRVGAETISSRENRPGARGEDCARPEIGGEASSRTSAIPGREGRGKGRACPKTVSSQRICRKKGICMWITIKLG